MLQGEHMGQLSETVSPVAIIIFRIILRIEQAYILILWTILNQIICKTTWTFDLLCLGLKSLKI